MVEKNEITAVNFYFWLPYSFLKYTPLVEMKAFKNRIALLEGDWPLN